MLVIFFLTGAIPGASIRYLHKAKEMFILIQNKLPFVCCASGPVGGNQILLHCHTTREKSSASCIKKKSITFHCRGGKACLPEGVTNKQPPTATPSSFLSSMRRGMYFAFSHLSSTFHKQFFIVYLFIILCQRIQITA